MKTRMILSILGAVVLLAAGLGASLTCVEGIKEKEIMSSGRRSSRLVSKEREPGSYWLNVSFYGVVGLGLLYAGGALIVGTFKR